ncbi:MFS transporter [Enterococcus sp. LJL120]
MESTQLSKRNLWSFSIGTVGRDMAAAGLFVNYLLNYVLFTKTLTAAQFSVITVIMVAARFFDAVIDPILGNVIDASHSKWGKFKPFILAGVIGTAIIVSLSFSSNLQGWPYVIFFGIMYFLFSIFFSINDIAYWGMIPALTKDQDGRNRLMSLTNLMAGIGAFLTALIVPTFTVGSLVIGGSAVTGYAAIGIGFSLIMLLTQAITLFGVEEPPRPAVKKETTKISVKEIVHIIYRNKQALWSGVILFVYMLVTTLSTTLVSTYLYFSFGYNGLLVTIFNIVGQVAGALVFIMFPAISKKFNRDTLIKIATTMSLTGYFLLLAAGWILPNSLEMTKLIILALVNILPAVGNGVFYLIIMISIANGVEWNDWKFGTRNEGIIFSVRPFVTQLGMGLGQFGTMLVYLVIGVLSTTNQISDLENQAAAGTISATARESMIQQILNATPEIKGRLLLIFLTVVPLIGITIAYTIYKKKGIMTESQFAQITEEIKERDAKAEVATSTNPEGDIHA